MRHGDMKCTAQLSESVNMYSLNTFLIIQEGQNGKIRPINDKSMHGLRTPRESFFQKLETFGLGQTNWAEIL